MLSRYFLFVKEMQINLYDILELKKNHPCGGKAFTVLRLGSDIKLRCNTCAKELTLPRIKLERMIRNLSHAGET